MQHHQCVRDLHNVFTVWLSVILEAIRQLVAHTRKELPHEGWDVSKRCSISDSLHFLGSPSVLLHALCVAELPIFPFKTCD